jgi:hypothetical protein
MLKASECAAAAIKDGNGDGNDNGVGGNGDGGDTAVSVKAMKVQQ